MYNKNYFRIILAIIPMIIWVLLRMIEKLPFMEELLWRYSDKLHDSITKFVWKE